MTCYNCNEEGHMSRECPQKDNSGRGGGGRGGGNCYNCGQPGHLSRDCTEPRQGGGGFGGGGGNCYNCGQPGHLSRDCTEPRQSAAPPARAAKKVEEEEEEDEDDFDMFGSDDEVDEEAEAEKQRRLAAYAEKKAKKPALIAKSNVILDVKPWDDETDLGEMETEIRKIETEGLLWGKADKKPVAFGVFKLVICAVVEDDKVSVDWLEEQITSLEDYVQSVDVAAFQKI